MNFEKILNKASLKLVNDSQKLRVQSKFYFTNRGNLGLLFFLILALFLLYVSLFRAKELGVQIFLVVFSLAILVFTIMVILKQIKDYVEVTGDTIKFSNSLKEEKIHLDSEFKIKVKSDIVYIKTSNPGSGSYFCLIELFLKIKDKKYRILDFQVDKKYSKEAKALGKEIKKMILEITNKV